MKIVTGILTFLVSISHANVLLNSDFGNGLTEWEIVGKASNVAAKKILGRNCAAITLTEEDEIGFPGIYQSVKVSPGELLYAEVNIMARNIHDGAGAYIVLEYMDANDKRMSYASSPRALGNRSILANPCNPKAKELLNR